MRELVTDILTVMKLHPVISTVALSIALLVFSATATNSYQMLNNSVAAAQPSVEELLTQLKSLQTQLAAKQAQVVTTYQFTRVLKVGDKGEDVRQLQILLNKDTLTQIAVSGDGSPGKETTYFGPATSRAVSKFQEKYKSEILTPNQLTKGTGTVGNATLKKLNALVAVTKTTGTPGNVAVTNQNPNVVNNLPTQTSNPSTTTQTTTSTSSSLLPPTNCGTPVITSATSANGTVGSAFSYSITITSIAAPTFSASGLPAGLTLSGSRISGTPTTAGTYTTTITATSNCGVGTKVLTITISDIVAGQTCPSVSQYGITWTFNKAYPCGQFVNGDWWVVGPVTITSISPGWDGTTNGSMVDPDPSVFVQGYDTRAYTFSDNLRLKTPVTLSGIKSIISTIGLAQVYNGGAHNTLDTAAVITVLNSVPANNGTTVFRPPYALGEKILWSTSQVNYALIPNLAVPAGIIVPDLSKAMKRLWLEHGPNVYDTTIHPQSNLYPYPRDSTYEMSDLSLAILLDIPQKREYANRLIQHGIDLYSVSLTNRDEWEANGGFGQGQKWPILFAGILLNNAAMKAPAATTFYRDSTAVIAKFSEDGYTYYGPATTGYPNGLPNFGYDDPNCSPTNYWGNHVCRDPDGLLYPEQLPNGGTYRTCCTSATWVGQALAARLMNAIPVWNHMAFFDYVDRWVSEGGSSDGFVQPMWQAYRGSGNIGCPVPTMSSPSTVVATVGKNFSYTLTSSTFVPSNNVVSYSVQNLPNGLTYSGNLISGTPSQSGTFVITVTPSSVCGSSTATVTMTIAPNNLSNIPNPVLYYSFDASTLSNNQVHDISGSNLGTITSATSMAGHSNEGLSFNNSSVIISSNSTLDNLPITSGMTLSFWINPQQVTSGMLVAKNCGLGESSGCWALKLVNGGLEYSQHGTASSLDVLTKSNLIVQNQWQHIAVVATGNAPSSSNVHLYINGIDVGSSGGSSLDSDVGNNLYIGNGLYGPGYAGSIDDFRVYNKPLSIDQIAALYQLTYIPQTSNVALVINAVGNFFKFLIGWQ